MRGGCAAVALSAAMAGRVIAWPFRLFGRCVRALAAPIGADDVLIAAGAGLLSYGGWLWWQPAGFLVGGSVLFGLGVLKAIAPAQK